MGSIKSIKDTLKAYAKLIGVVLSSSFSNIKRNDDGDILFVAWYLPPSVSSGVYRPLSFIKYAESNSLKMSCVSGYLDEPSLSVGKILEEELSGTVYIERALNLELQVSWVFFPRIQEGSFLDVISIYKSAVDKYKHSPPKIIVATGPPFSDFIAATLLAKKFSSKLILDYRDEWSERPFGLIKKEFFDRRLEQWCLSNADAVIFTTESQIEHQLEVFDILKKKKCHYIPNGWDKGGRSVIREVEKSCDRRNTVVISYIGHLGAHADFYSFLACLEMVIDSNDAIDIRIDLIGDVGARALRSMEKFSKKIKINIIGRVPKSKVSQYAKDSDLLLLMSDKDLARYRPGKIYDYIASKTPTLVYGCEGEVKDIVCGLDAGFFVKSSDHQGLEAAILNSKGFNLSDKQNNKINAWLERHERDVLANKFFNIVMNIN